MNKCSDFGVLNIDLWLNFERFEEEKTADNVQFEEKTANIMRLNEEKKY